MHSESSSLHTVTRQVFLDFGERVFTEERLKGLIGDYGGISVRKYDHVITQAIHYEIGAKLLKIHPEEESDYLLKLNNIRQNFQEENFFRHSIANYIIDCYLFAFGWIDDVGEYDEDDNNSDTKAGELSFIEHCGLDYCGNFSEINEKSGFGIAKTPDNSYYAGEWKLNVRNGIGIEVCSKKNKYAGEWRLNRRAGVGIETMIDGKRYAGEWKNGKPHGLGILVYSNGEKMSAKFCNGCLVESSTGIYYFKDGSFVVGEMTKEGPSGLCSHYYKEDKVVTEEWYKGKIKK